MKKKFLLYSLCLLTFIACKSGSTEIERLTLSPSSTILDSLFTQLPGSLILCNNYLVWEDPFNPNYFLHVVDINAKKEIGTMGLIGRGPKEFITPLSISSIGNKIFTYDLNQNKQAYYSIDSMLANKDPFILLPPLPIEDCLDIVQIAEGEFISTHPQNEQLFQWIHQDSTVSFFGKSPIKEKLKDYYNSRQGTLFYNPYNQKLIYSASLFPYIALYEKEGNNFQLKWEKVSSKNFYEIKNGNIHFIEEAQVPHEIILTKDYIITLEKEENTPTPTKRTAGIRDLSQVPNTIFVYDYDFNLKKIIDMGMPILRIETKGNSNTIYAVGIDLDFCIVTYEI
ncbi:BF3164 family lipoprotein [Butyricimonas paravirosa]|uniref:BF3164 family lipoprotein n=1 Tax=Butyricimonas paravirosa TaxID=1472417 RepID=UPI0022E00003|nr:BF3164 family lipoprotein [Butyricimonas paravirosa]